MSQLRVLHAPINIGNQSCSLGSLERIVSNKYKMDFLNHVVDFFPSKFSYQADEIFLFNPSIAGNLYRRLLMSLYAVKSYKKYDIFHFYFGKSFFPPFAGIPIINYLDLKVFKKLGKKCFMTFQGCDARIKQVAKNKKISACHEIHCKNKWCNDKLDSFKTKNIKAISDLCSHVFCLNPDIMTNVPGSEFLPYCIYNQVERREARKKRLLIVHAPTDRDIKGTKYITKTFEILRRNYPVDCIIVENMTHRKALDIYKEADLLVDQLLVGWYGGLAVELMQMGVPVVANIFYDDLKYIPSLMREEIPIINSTPESIEDMLISLVKDRDRLLELGVRSKNYVSRWHNAETIARSMIGLYKDPSKSFWDEYLKIMRMKNNN